MGLPMLAEQHHLWDNERAAGLHPDGSTPPWFLADRRCLVTISPRPTDTSHRVPDFVWEPKLPMTPMQQWAADAENVGVWTPRRAQCMPLVYFPDDHLVDIRLDVEDERKPAYWLNLGLAQVQSRSWLEWHWQRGIDPDDDRRRPAIPTWIRHQVMERDGLVCQICTLDVDPSDVHLDHIKPWSRGGQHTIANLRVTHSRCNLRKWAHYTEDNH